VRGILIVLIDIEEDWRLRQALDDQQETPAARGRQHRRAVTTTTAT
jgi:hypothetical protein